MKDTKHLRLCESEVEKVFSRPIELLLNDDYKIYENVLRPGSTKSIRMPVYGQDAGDERIWGLTAFITDQVLHAVVEPTISA